MAGQWRPEELWDERVRRVHELISPNLGEGRSPLPGLVPDGYGPPPVTQEGGAGGSLAIKHMQELLNPADISEYSNVISFGGEHRGYSSALPASTLVGDLLIAGITGNQTYIPPTGWTEIFDQAAVDNNSLTVYTKICDDPAEIVTFNSVGGVDTRLSGGIIAFHGGAIEDSTYLLKDSYTGTHPTSNFPVTLPTLTAEEGDFILHLAFRRDGSTGVVAGPDLNIIADQADGGVFGFIAGLQEITSDGTSATQQFTSTFIGTNFSELVLLAIRIKGTAVYIPDDGRYECTYLPLPYWPHCWVDGVMQRIDVDFEMDGKFLIPLAPMNLDPELEEIWVGYDYVYGESVSDGDFNVPSGVTDTDSGSTNGTAHTYSADGANVGDLWIVVFESVASMTSTPAGWNHLLSNFAFGGGRIMNVLTKTSVGASDPIPTTWSGTGASLKYWYGIAIAGASVAAQSTGDSDAGVTSYTTEGVAAGGWTVYVVTASDSFALDDTGLTDPNPSSHGGDPSIAIVIDETGSGAATSVSDATPFNVGSLTLQVLGA